MSNLWENVVRQIHLEQTHAYSYWWVVITIIALCSPLSKASLASTFIDFFVQVKNPTPAGFAVGGFGPITTSWDTRKSARTDTRGQLCRATVPCRAPLPRTVPALCPRLPRYPTSYTDSSDTCPQSHVSHILSRRVKCDLNQHVGNASVYKPDVNLASYTLPTFQYIKIVLKDFLFFVWTIFFSISKAS